MMKKVILIAAILATILLTLTQCNKDKICTADFRSVTLTLKYSDEQPVLLDSLTVFWESENRYIRQESISWEGVPPNGDYLIVDDGMQKELEGEKETMRFTGFLDDKVIFKKDILVGADQCHVKYLGKESLVQTINKQ